MQLKALYTSIIIILIKQRKLKALELFKHFIAALSYFLQLLNTLFILTLNH